MPGVAPDQFYSLHHITFDKRFWYHLFVSFSCKNFSISSAITTDFGRPSLSHSSENLSGRSPFILNVTALYPAFFWYFSDAMVCLFGLPLGIIFILPVFSTPQITGYNAYYESHYKCYYHCFIHILFTDGFCDTI